MDECPASDTTLSTSVEPAGGSATSRRIPGPRGHWLLGSLHEFRRDRLHFYERSRDRYGGYTAFRLAHHRMLLVCDPEGIEQVLVTRNRDFRKHYMLRLLQPLLGRGLLTGEGDAWLRQRRLVQPLFARQRLDGYGSVFARHAERELADWRDGESRDVHADMQRLAMGIVLETLMGLEMKSELYDEVNAASEVVTEDFAWRFEQGFLLPYWVPTRRNRAHRAAVAGLERVVRELVRERRRKPSESDDLLARLIRARDEGDGRGMSDTQLRDEVMTLFLAGHETTANALTWTCYLLARHPHVMRRLRDETKRVVGERPVTVDDVPRLELIERVLKESMRLYPPAYAFGREVVRDTELGGYAVRRGTTVIMPQWAVHRDPRFYERPEEFDPDRWSPEFERGLPKYAYFPFGGGPRVCIGNTFAQLEASIVLATLVSRVDLELVADHPVELWPSITLRPRHGIRVVVRRPTGDDARGEVP